MKYHGILWEPYPTLAHIVTDFLAKLAVARSLGVSTGVCWSQHKKNDGANGGILARRALARRQHWGPSRGHGPPPEGRPCVI